MFKITLEVQLKETMTQKQSYEKIAKLIRKFISINNKELIVAHDTPSFSYYSFSTLFPLEKNRTYKEGGTYTIELRTLKNEFLDLKKYKGLENESLVLLSANGGKLYFRGSGVLKTESPAYLNSQKIKDETYANIVKERIRENILFRYVKSGRNRNDDLPFLRENVIQRIDINPRIITIPFSEKKLKNGDTLLYHCLHIEVTFQDNDIAKEVEQVIYAGGIGLNTSNGFGFVS